MVGSASKRFKKQITCRLLRVEICGNDMTDATYKFGSICFFRVKKGTSRHRIGPGARRQVFVLTPPAGKLPP